MTTDAFRFPGQEPVDPDYVAFRDGWTTWIIDKPPSPGLRWNPSAPGWRTYPPEKFHLIDFGVSGPASPLKSVWSFGTPQGARVAWADSFFVWTALPRLWHEIKEAYARIRDTRRSAVWNPYDGAWREARPSYPTPGPGGPSAPGDTPSPGGLVHPELQRRLDALHALHRNGSISDEILQQRALELTREYI